MGLTDEYGGLGSALGSVVGNYEAQGDQENAKKQYQAALDALRGLQVPDIEKQRIALSMLGGPEQLGQSLMAGAAADPTSIAAQKGALAQLQSVAGRGGMDLGSQIALNQALGRSNQNEAANRKALMASFAARGMGGSGAELAAQLANQQGSAQGASMASGGAAGDAASRALQAMQQSGALGSQLRGQSFAEQSARAQAQDAINRYNLQNRLDTQRYNNALQNQQEMYNKGLYQQQFGNQMARAQALQNAYGNMGNYYQGAANRTRQQYQGAGEAFGSAAGGGADTVLGMVGGGMGGGGGFGGNPQMPGYGGGPGYNPQKQGPTYNGSMFGY